MTPLQLEISPPVLVSDDPQDWMLRILAGGAAGDVRVVDQRPIVTEVGWPGVLVRATSAPGQTERYCVGGFYRFLHYVAAVVVRSATNDAIARREEDLLAMFLSARPDWNDAEPVALSELWRL
jgi:hypothetical protein